MKGDNGEHLVSEEQVSGRWREYFEKVLNEENEWNDELSADYVEGPADMISKEEVRQAIQDLKVRTKMEAIRKMQRSEMRMLRWMAGVSLSERKSNECVRSMLAIDDVAEVM